MKNLLILLFIFLCLGLRAQSYMYIPLGEHPETKEFAFGFDYTYYSPKWKGVVSGQTYAGHITGLAGYNLSKAKSRRKFALLVGGTVDFSYLFNEDPSLHRTTNSVFGLSFQYDIGRRFALKMQGLAKIDWKDFESTKGELFSIGVGANISKYGYYSSP